MGKIAKKTRPRDGKIINCEFCNKEVYFTPKRLENKHYTCSKQCRLDLDQKLNKYWMPTSCHFCEKEVLYRKKVLREILYPSCSRTCSSKIRAISYNKNQNPNSLKLTEFEKVFWEKTKDYERRAKCKKVNFDLDYIFLIDLYNKQNGNCYYTNLPMKVISEKVRGVRRSAAFNIISLDRIDSNLGYVKNNVVFCLNSINMMKSNHKISDIKTVFKALYMKEKNDIRVRVKKLYEDSKLPKQSDPLAAGYDVFAHRIEDCGTYIKVFTGIAVQPDMGYFFLLSPRSSIYKQGLSLYSSIGIIDNNYIGEITGIFIKTKDFIKLPEVGDRLMQLIPQEQIWVNLEEVTELELTARGSGGWGSTGQF